MEWPHAAPVAADAALNGDSGLRPWFADQDPRIARWYIIAGIPWGEIELEPEVRDWLEMLSTSEFATTAFYLDLLAEQGPLLSEPYTKQLSGSCGNCGPTWTVGRGGSATG